MSERLIRVDEIFGPTLQGEGPMIGTPVLFVRTGGCDYRCCDYRCAWCDTLHAVLPEYRKSWRPMSADHIIDELLARSKTPMWVVISGGNPAMQALSPLLEKGQALGFRFALETQGSLSAPWFAQLDQLVISPKPPSAHIKHDWDALSACIAAGPEGKMALKVPVLDEADFAFAQQVHQRHPDLPINLQPVNTSEVDQQQALMAQMRWLVDQVNQAAWYQVRVLPQLHVMMWGDQRGV